MKLTRRNLRVLIRESLNEVTQPGFEPQYRSRETIIDHPYNVWKCSEYTDFLVAFRPDEANWQEYTVAAGADADLMGECSVLLKNLKDEVFAELKEKGVVTSWSEVQAIFDKVRELFKLPSRHEDASKMFGKKKRDAEKKVMDDLKALAAAKSNPWQDDMYRTSEGEISWIVPDEPEAVIAAR